MVISSIAEDDHRIGRNAQTMAQKKVNGYTLWEGASLYDGSPIAVILTGIESKSTNAKTGAMLQTYIFRQDIRPSDALKTGDDVSICGDCRHRPILARKSGEATCYVEVGKGVNSTWGHISADDIPKPPPNRSPTSSQVGRSGLGRMVTHVSPL